MAVMVQQLQVGDITAELVLKNIKTVRVTVYAPTGLVRISAPRRMKVDAVLAFANSRLGWIKRQQVVLRKHVREPTRRYVDGESHYLWGERRLLEVSAADAPPSVELKDGRIVLQVRPRTPQRKREALIEAWYRDQIRAALHSILARWQPRMGVEVKRVFVQRMKTRWGTCNYRARTIRLNTELVHRRPHCLEYIVVHELAHLLEPTHNARFRALMDRFMPGWRPMRDELNRAPSSQEPSRVG